MEPHHALSPDTSNESASTPEFDPDHIFAASAPIHPIKESETTLEQKTSAPAGLFSLLHGHLPPFKRPLKEPKPRLLINSVMTKNDVIEMVGAIEENRETGLVKYLKDFLPVKNVTTKDNLSERRFLTILIKELIDYGACRDFDEYKLSVLINVYLGGHLYFKWHYWSPPQNIWDYFKDIMIRHTIEDSPDGQEVFDPNECYDILSHFHTTYLSNLPLIHIAVFGVHSLKFVWPFSKK